MSESSKTKAKAKGKKAAAKSQEGKVSCIDAAAKVLVERANR